MSNENIFATRVGRDCVFQITRSVIGCTIKTTDIQMA